MFKHTAMRQTKLKKMTPILNFYITNQLNLSEDGTHPKPVI